LLINQMIFITESVP